VSPLFLVAASLLFSTNDDRSKDPLATVDGSIVAEKSNTFAKSGAFSLHIDINLFRE
jgi:hypothetical protein